MPRPAWWTCRVCSRTLGQVSKDGVLRVQPDCTVTVPKVDERADVVVVVCCGGCGQARQWSPWPPGFEVKAG